MPRQKLSALRRGAKHPAPSSANAAGPNSGGRTGVKNRPVLPLTPAWLSVAAAILPPTAPDHHPNEPPGDQRSAYQSPGQSEGASVDGASSPGLADSSRGISEIPKSSLPTPSRFQAALRTADLGSGQSRIVDHHRRQRLRQRAPRRGKVSRHGGGRAFVRVERLKDPYPVWPAADGPKLVIAPMFLLYDYSFRPDDIAAADVVAWAAAEKSCVRTSCCSVPRPIRTGPPVRRPRGTDRRAARSAAGRLQNHPCQPLSTRTRARRTAACSALFAVVRHAAHRGMAPAVSGERGGLWPSPYPSQFRTGQRALSRGPHSAIRSNGPGGFDHF